MPATTSSASAPTTKTARRRLAVLVTAIVCLAVTAFAPFRPAMAGNGQAKSPPFSAGERLVYDITWMGILGGSAILGARDGGAHDGSSVLAVYLEAKSTGWVRSLYRVDDNSLSLFNASNLRSEGVDIRISEGGYQKRKKIDFDHDRGLAFYSVDGEEPQEYQIDPGTLDAFSVLFAYRATLPRVKVGDTVTFPVFDDRKKYLLRIQAVRKERIRAAGGYVDTIVVEPALMSEGIFQRRGKMTIWFSDDEAFAPVMMSSKVILGSFYATLRQWSGVRITVIPDGKADAGKTSGPGAEAAD